MLSFKHLYKNIFFSGIFISLLLGVRFTDNYSMPTDRHFVELTIESSVVCLPCCFSLLPPMQMTDDGQMNSVLFH